MKDVMKYKGFTGSVALDLEDFSIRGKILFISDLVTYEADSAKEIEAEFHAAVDDYLETCKMLGREPLKPCSGTLNVRIGSELHQKLAVYSTLKEKSINSVIKASIARFLDDPEQKSVIHNHFHASPVVAFTKSITYNPEDKVVHIRGTYVPSHN